MEMFIDLGSGTLSPTACYLNGMVMMIMLAWLGLNLERPKKEDY
jgi:hypothetical protein